MPTITDHRVPLIIYNPNTLAFGLWDGSLTTGAVVIGAVTQSGAWTVTANAGTNLNTSALATQTTLAALLTELQLKADLSETQPVSMAAIPTGGIALADTFKTRSDTYTGTGNGTTVTITTAPLNVFAVQVTGTGAAASAWDVRLEGSLDGVNFSQILAHTNVTGDGVVLWLGATLSPSLYFRSRCAGLTLGTATNIVVTILGVTR